MHPPKMPPYPNRFRRRPKVSKLPKAEPTSRSVEGSGMNTVRNVGFSTVAKVSMYAPVLIFHTSDLVTVEVTGGAEATGEQVAVGVEGQTGDVG